MQRRRIVWTLRGLVPLLLGLALLALVVYLIGPEATLRTLLRLRVWQGAVLVGAALLSSVFAALALRIIFDRYGESVSVWLLFRLSLVAFAVGWLIPSGYAAGFPVVAYALTRRGVRFGHALASFLIQRFLELAAYAVILPILVLGGLRWRLAFWSTLGPLLALSIVVLDHVLGWRLARRTLALLLPRVPSALRPALEGAIYFCAIVASFFEAPLRLVASAAGLSVLSIGTAFVRAVLTARFLNLGLGIPEIALVLAFTLVALAVPLAPGALGVYEGGMVGIFHLLGRPPADGIAFAVTVHAVELVVALLGLVFLTQLGIDPAALRPPAGPRDRSAGLPVPP